METFSIPDIPIWSIIKVFVAVALLLYLVFALVVVRQVQLMTDTLEVDFESMVRLLAVAHLVFAITVFILALVIL